MREFRISLDVNADSALDALRKAVAHIQHMRCDAWRRLFERTAAELGGEVVHFA